MEHLLFPLIIIVPIAGAFLLPLIGIIWERFRNVLAFLLVLVSLVSSIALLPYISSGRVLSFGAIMPHGFNVTFQADGLAVFMAIVSSLVGSIIVLFSFAYISHYRNRNEYYFMVLIFIGAMMGLVYSANLICLYIFWEITALASWRLIGFYRKPEDVAKAGKAMLVTVFGALAMLAGFIMLAEKAGSFDMSVLKGVFKSGGVPPLAVGLILIGIFTKSATLPFHTWLPDAGVAPSPVTALLHAAVLVKIGTYVFARLFVATLPLDQIWHTIIPWLCAASALVSACAALIETDMKRIIAYSTVSQIAFIFLGFSLGNAIGIAGSLMYIMMHGISKGGLFLCAGIIEQNMKTKDITRMGGLIKTMPVTAVSFLFCAFSVMGIPPFGGFFSKYLVMASVASTGNTALTGVFLLGAFLTILYLMRLFSMIFLGDSVTAPVKESSPLMVVSVSILAVLSLAGGVCINQASSLVQIAAKQISGVI